ncbi:MAG: hypothetical protein JNM10_11980 [Planctomycetia bacterium]|nr:hypothetical protein [Planctomycetia bacterium]
MRRWLGFVGVAFLSLGAAAKAEGPAAADEPLGWRRFPVADLVAGTRDALPDRLPWIVPPGEDDDDHPRFGGEAEEVTLPFGSTADLVERVKAAVGAPATWDREGTSIEAVEERALVVRQTAEVLEATARFLDGLRADASRSVAIDVVALAGDGAGLAAADGAAADLAAAVASGRLVPLDLARAHGRVAQRVTGRGGRQRAFVARYDVMVAKEATVADPVVGVLSEGVGFDARAWTLGPTAIRLEVRAAWGRLASMGTATGADTGPIGTPHVRGASTSAVLDVAPGAWSLLPSSGGPTDGVVFVVRATPVRPAPPPAALPSAAPVADPPEGALESASIDVSDLLAPVHPRRGRAIDLAPSGYVPPEPPELPDARPSIGADALLAHLRRTVAPATWEREGVALTLHLGRVELRQDAPRIAAVRSAVDGLRATLRAPARVRLVTVRLPLAAVPEWWTGLDEACLADGGAGLLARAGAVIVARASLRLPDGGRDASVVGTEVAYLADFATKVAEQRVGVQPVPARVLDGASEDVAFVRAGGGALLELRLDRGRVERIERTPTPHGDLDLPVLRVGKVRGSLVTAFDATHVVAADLDGDALTLTLLVVHATNP